MTAILLAVIVSILALPALLPAEPRATEAPTLAVAVAGAEDAPLYLAVHAALALGTFEAEGVQVVLRRTKHPSAAINALRDDQVAVAVTTADQAVRGAWAHETPVRVLVAHTRTPATLIVVSTKHRGEVIDVADLRGKRVGIPAPGVTAHLVLETLLRARKLEPWQVQIRSPGATALLTQLTRGELDAAALDEPAASRAVAAGAATVLIDLRRTEDATRHLGGPFHEVVSVVRADEQKLAARAPALAAYARALVRVQAWLAASTPEAIADRLPASLVRDRERFIARVAAVHATYSPDGEATPAGLASTLGVLRAGSPWPVALKLEPEALREPDFVTAARKALGAAPPAP